MKLFGSITELVTAVFRKNSQSITLRPSNTTTYTASRTVDLPPQDANAVIVSESATQTLTNKSIDADTNTVTNIENADIKSGAAIDATKIANGSVSNTEFQYLDGVTSAIQTQLGGKVDGPASATDNAVTRFDSTTGKLVQNSVVTVDDTGVVAGASISGGSNTITNVSLTAGVTGTLPIANGGTGQTSATAAFNALDPLTTKGDLIVHNGTDSIRLAVGSNNTVLVADSAEAAGVKWANASGGGSGEVNAVLNPSASNDLTGYTDGTSHTSTRVTSGSPLDPATTTAISIAASTTASESSTSGTYYTISTMPTGLRNRKLKVEFYFTTEASQTWAVGVYAGSTRMALSSDSSGATLLPAGTTGKFTAYFDTDSSTSYTVHLTRTAGSGTATLIATSLIVGPGIQPQGSVVSALGLLPFTVSGGGTLTNTNYDVTRIGNLMQVRGRWTNGSSSGTTISINLPSGYTLDSSKLSNQAFGQPLGTMNWTNQNGTANDIFANSLQGTLFYDGSDTARVYIATQDSSSNTLRKMTDTNLWTSGESVAFYMTIPIAEWAGSGTVSLAQNDVEYAYNSGTAGSNDITSFAYGPAGVAAGAANASIVRRVRFISPIQATDRIAIEASFDRVKWFEVEAWIYNNSQAIQPLALQNTVYYGIGVDESQSAGAYASPGYEVDVRFGAYGSTTGGQGYGGSGLAWGTGAIYWRLKKTAAGVATGFGTASATQAGLVTLPSSMISVDTSNGYGSTGTRVRRFTNVTSTTGSDITYTASATNGDSFTINRNGIYAISYSQSLQSVGINGISINASITTDVDSLSPANRLASVHNVVAATRVVFCGWTGRLSSGDVIRAHSDTSAGGGINRDQFTITQIAILP